MANDDYKLILWSDGEAIRDDDLTNNGKHALARLLDAFLEKIAPGPEVGIPFGGAGEDGTNVMFPGAHGADLSSNLFAYALASGGAYPRKGTTNTKIQIAPGTLFQKVAAHDGNEATFVPFTFVGTEEVTIANGDAANPRVDLVEMKLEWEDGNLVARDFEDAITGALTSSNTNKHRRVKCTLQVKQGAPAASPTYPTLDAGYVAIAGVVVPATWTGASAPVVIDTAGAASLVIHDQRMPIGTPRPYTKIAPREWFGQQDGAHWSPAASGYQGMTNVTAGSGDALAACPGCGGGRYSGIGRIVSVEAHSNVNAGTISTSPTLARMVNTGGVVTFVNLNSVASLVNAASAVLWQDRRVFEGNHSAAAGPTVQANAAGMGPPVWTNGCRAVAPASSDQTADSSQLVLRWPAPNAASSLTVWRATFFVAEGL